MWTNPRQTEVVLVCSICLSAIVLGAGQNQSVGGSVKQMDESGDVRVSETSGQTELAPGQDPTINELFRWGIGTKLTGLLRETKAFILNTEHEISMDIDIIS